MARDLEQLVLTLSADIRSMEKGLARAQGKFDKTSREIERRQRELDKNLSKLGEGLGAGFGRASLLAGTAMGAIIGYSIKTAAAAGEIQDAFKIAFGEGAAGAKAYAETLSQEVGRSQLEIQESMIKFRLLLKDQDAATAEAITRELQARAIDVGSLYNLKDAEVVQKFFSGLSGEAEPLKSVGVNMNEAALKAELLRLGFKGSAQAASEQAKQVARANIILRETQVAAGNASDTIGSTANQFKKLQGETRDASAAFGEQFLPVANQVLAWASEALASFNELPKGTQAAGLGILALVAAGGPVVAAIGALARLISYARNAQVALAALGGAGALAGAGAAATAGATGLGAGAVAGGAAIGVSTFRAQNYRAVAESPGKANEAQLAAAARYAEANIKAYEKLDGGNPQGQAKVLLERFRTEFKAIEAERQRQTKAAGAAIADEAAAAARAAAAEATGGFGLSGDQLESVGGGSGGGAAARKAKREAERLADQALRQQERTADLLIRADFDLLSARMATATEAEARLALELEGLAMDRAARAAELDYAVLQGDLTAAQAARVTAAEEAVRTAEEANLRRARDEALAQEALDDRLGEIEIEGRRLGLQAQLAETAAQRRDIELRILALQIEEERVRLEAVAASAESTRAQKELARRQLAALGGEAELGEAAVRRATQGPLEAYVSAHASAARLGETLEGIAVGGFDRLTDSLVEAAMNAEDLGDVARNVFRQMIADIAAAQIKRGLASLIPGFAGLFATGGTIPKGKWGVVGERGPEPVMSTANGVRVLPNNALRGLGQAQPAARATVVQQFFPANFQGAVVTEDLMQRFKGYADARAAEAGMASFAAARSNIPAQMQRKAARSLR